MDFGALDGNMSGNKRSMPESNATTADSMLESNATTVDSPLPVDDKTENYVVKLLQVKEKLVPAFDVKTKNRNPSEVFCDLFLFFV